MKKLFALVFALAVMASAQSPTVNSTTTQVGVFPTATATVSRSIKAMHYRLQGGSVKIDFRGSDLMQRASGEAKVEGKKTNFEIEARFEGFEDVLRFFTRGAQSRARLAALHPPPDRPRCGRAHCPAFIE